MSNDCEGEGKNGFPHLTSSTLAQRPQPAGSHLCHNSTPLTNVGPGLPIFQSCCPPCGSPNFLAAWGDAVPRAGTGLCPCSWRGSSWLIPSMWGQPSLQHSAWAPAGYCPGASCECHLSHHQRIIQVGREDRGSYSPTSCSKWDSYKTRLHCLGLGLISNIITKTSKDRNCTAFLGYLFHCFSVLMVKKLFLLSSPIPLRVLLLMRLSCIHLEHKHYCDCKQYCNWTNNNVCGIFIRFLIRVTNKGELLFISNNTSRGTRSGKEPDHQCCERVTVRRVLLCFT